MEAVKVPAVEERFFKYHGLGNDFVILDRRGSGRDIGPEASVRLCDRRRGIGADGVLVMLPAEGASARMVVHNADGSIAEMCGNGLRCAAKFLLDHAPDRPERIAVMTGAGLLWCDASWAGGEVREVEISMGPARLVAPNLPTREGPFVRRELPGYPGVVGTAVSMGNPHLVLFDRPLAEAGTLGPKLEHAPGFQDRTNVEFVRQTGEGLEVVVWERGCGLTQACGTGACASVAAGVHEGRLPADAWVQVKLPGGPLRIRVAKDLSEVRMRGPAAFVFEGHLPPAEDL
jgi:diaminopimelate epimerase